MAIPPLHKFVQLCGAYGLSVQSALWRTVALAIFAFIAGPAFFMLLLAAGLLG